MTEKTSVIIILFGCVFALLILFIGHKCSSDKFDEPKAAEEGCTCIEGDSVEAERDRVSEVVGGILRRNAGEWCKSRGYGSETDELEDKNFILGITVTETLERQAELQKKLDEMSKDLASCREGVSSD